MLLCGGLAESADYVAPVVQGSWISDCLSIDEDSFETYLLVSYTFGSSDDPTYKLQVDTFQTAGCSGQYFLRQQFIGSYALWQPPTGDLELGSDGNSSMAYVNLTYTSKPLTLGTNFGVTALELECSALYGSLSQPIQLNTPYDAFTVGCASLGIANKSTCPVEYDIVATFDEDTLISMGNRVSSNGQTSAPCTIAERPTNFGYVAHKCPSSGCSSGSGSGGSSTPGSTPTPVLPTPTSVGSTTLSLPALIANVAFLVLAAVSTMLI